MNDGNGKPVTENGIPGTGGAARYYRSPVRIFLILSVSIFFSGILAASALHQLALPTAAEILLSPVLQLMLLLPVLHFFLFRPLVHYMVERGRIKADLQIGKRKQAEEMLRRTNEMLEQRVQLRTSELAKVNRELKREIAERKLIEAKLVQQARTDDLTGICNRRQFDIALTMELERVRRYHSTPFLIMFDIDHFKRINDDFGHQQGDAILKELTRLVAGEIRANDVFARWGGEEFVLIVFENDLAGARRIAEKLKAAIERHPFPRVGHITCSFGVTACIADEEASQLMNRVDKLMYRAKDKGRNRVEAQ